MWSQKEEEEEKENWTKNHPSDWMFTGTDIVQSADSPNKVCTWPISVMRCLCIVSVNSIRFGVPAWFTVCFQMFEHFIIQNRTYQYVRLSNRSFVNETPHGNCQWKLKLKLWNCEFVSFVLLRDFGLHSGDSGEIISQRKSSARCKGNVLCFQVKNHLW